MRKTPVLLASWLTLTLASAQEPAVEHSKAWEPCPVRATLLSVERIWDEAPHNAFTDLVRWRGRFWCAFREGQGHAGDRGHVRVITSEDGSQWRSAAFLGLAELDLRDADLSVTPDDRLLVLGGAQRVQDGVRETGSFVSRSVDGEHFEEPRIVIPPGRWLWRLTWLDGFAYGVSYPTPVGEPSSALLRSEDGIEFETLVPELFSEGRPTEAVVAFDRERVAYCLHRRDGSPNTAVLGRAAPPYREWEWSDLGVRLGGPNLIRTPGGRWLAAGRRYETPVSTQLHYLDLERSVLTSLLTLPSGGDTSYPGLVWHAGELWMSYYSSHEGKASIYLARIAIDETDEGRDGAPEGGGR